MIQLIEGLPDAVVGIEAVGQVEAADYDAVAAPAVKHALERHPKIRIIHVLDDRFRGSRRLATVAGWSIPGELQLFSNCDRRRAEAWASEGLDAP